VIKLFIDLEWKVKYITDVHNKHLDQEISQCIMEKNNLEVGCMNFVLESDPPDLNKVQN